MSFLLAACGGGGGGGDGGNDAEASALGPPVRAEMGPAGGTVAVPIGAGITAELEFPAGALREAVSLTLTPEAPEPGAQVRLRIEPGVQELAKPVTLRLKGAAAPASGITAFYVGSLAERMFVPSTKNPATGTVTAQTQLLVLDAAEAQGAAALAAAPGRARILAAGPLNSGGSNAGFINVAQMECLVLLPELEVQILRARQWEFTAHRVYQLTQTLKAVQPMCSGNGDAAAAAELQLKIQEIEQRACEALVRNVDDIAFFPDLNVSAEVFYERANKLLGAQAAKDLVGGECNPQMTMMQAYAKTMNDYITAYSARVNAPDFGGPGWLSRRGELRHIIRLHEDATMLDMSTERQAVVDTVLKPALAKLHVRAFKICDRDNPAEHGPLADLMTGGQVYGNPISYLAFDHDGRTLIPPGIALDIQHCASRLTIQAYDGTEALPGQTLELGGGDMPGTQVTQGTIKLPVAEGVLSIDGVVRPLLCASPDAEAAYDPSTLVIKFNGVTVRELSPTVANFLPEGPMELDMQAMYDAAGLDANAPGTYKLEMFRQGTGCDGVFGEASVKLFEVTVTGEAAAALSVAFVLESDTEPGCRAWAVREAGPGPEVSNFQHFDSQPSTCAAQAGSARAMSSLSATVQMPLLSSGAALTLEPLSFAFSIDASVQQSTGAAGERSDASISFGMERRWVLRVGPQPLQLHLTSSFAGPNTHYPLPLKVDVRDAATNSIASFGFGTHVVEIPSTSTVTVPAGGTVHIGFYLGSNLGVGGRFDELNSPQSSSGSYSLSQQLTLTFSP
jgi:hypothetical protein